jgi:DNA-binding IclR family transcriptional regulator
VLDLLGRGAVGVTEGARALSVNKSTASRLFANMALRGYAARDPASGVYRLGPRVANLYQAYIAGRRLGRDATLLLERVAAATGETAILTAFESGRAVYIDRVISEHPLRTSARIGQPAPLHAGAAGKSILAMLPPPEVDALLGDGPLERFGRATLTDRDRLRSELALVRQRGYAVSVEEINEGIIGVGIPLLSPDGRPIGAIGVTGPKARFGDARIREIAASLLACAKQFGWLLPAVSENGRDPRRRPAARAAKRVTKRATARIPTGRAAR